MRIIGLVLLVTAILLYVAVWVDVVRAELRRRRRRPTLINRPRDEPDPIVRLYFRDDTFLAVPRPPAAFSRCLVPPWGTAESHLADCWERALAEVEERHHGPTSS
jgi:hypothetical protein